MAIDSTFLAKVKTALRITTDAYDDELTDKCEEALDDIGIAGIDGPNAVISNSQVRRAVITYCRLNFGSPDDYDRLKASYDEQKKQMRSATGWTTWGTED